MAQQPHKPGNTILVQLTADRKRVRTALDSHKLRLAELDKLDQATWASEISRARRAVIRAEKRLQEIDTLLKL